ncbi:hypothetical protein [Mangrovimonas spongiae]|uniref:DUF4258 domain-containing protein n=1 Tax=Mangrovimonas spongiae TaxID=2494697 RepID=A0A428JX96_9FLAO|nr:hypothetical protein [Mangrovimonas spongiae]RSK38704.1 hypothetical protein EJA19_11650 [Mangrovimonas spongiae]
MKFIHRLGFYLGGFSIGLVFLFFFLNGKKVSCDYGPEARVKKNINNKPLQYNANIESKVLSGELDSLLIDKILKEGDVIFSKSTPRSTPCGIYFIEGEIDSKAASLQVENCDSIATVKAFTWE